MQNHTQALFPFGAVLDDISALDATYLKTLLAQHKIILMRGAAYHDKAALIEFAQTLGDLLAWDFGTVMEMRVDAEPKNYLFTHGAVPFHWDGAFYREPRYLLFQCIEAPLPDCGGETLFCDTTAIWRQASEQEKTYWRSLQLTYATQKIAHYGGRIMVNMVQKHIDHDGTILRFAEPVPETMLNPVSLTINDFTEQQTQVFVKNMQERCYHPDNCYTHTWQQGDLLIADNYALIHARHAFKQFSPRHLRRIQIL